MTDFALLHGGGQGSWVWEQTVAALLTQSGGTARCLTLDVPGCGEKRDRDTAATTFDEIAVELIADIEAAGMEEVILVGHSQAGSTLPMMAALKPALFRRLVFVTCLATPPGRTSIEIMGNCRHGESDTEVGWPVDPETASIEERLRAMFCNDMAPAEADAFFARLLRDNWPMSTYGHRDWDYEHLKAVCSTYVLCTRDRAIPPKWQERFAERFYVDRIVRIDAGHQAMNTCPEELAGILLAQSGD